MKKPPSIQNYRTPQKIFRGVEKFLECEFDLDAFADDNNSLCERYFTEKEDGLKKSWSHKFIKNVWCNPPYKKGFMELLLDKIITERENCEIISVLCLASTSSLWFHRALEAGASIVLYKRRIQFEHETILENNPSTQNILLIFQNGRYGKFYQGCAKCGFISCDFYSSCMCESG